MRQDDVAVLLGTTQSSVSGWVNGKYEPSAATVFALERALDVDPGSLSRPLGYLPVDSESQTVTVESAIAQSRQLDDDDKAALAAVYRALLKRRSPVSAGGERPRTQAGTSNRAAVRPRSVAGGR